MLRILLSTLWIVVIATGSAITLAAESPVDRGRETYARVGCYECHGYVGQGGGGPRIAPSPMPYEAFVDFVRYTQGRMPAYSEMNLPDEDFVDIYAYLESIPEPQPVDTIPALRDLKNTN